VPDDPDGTANVFAMRLGRPMLGEYSSLADTKAAALDLSAGPAPGVVLVQDGATRAAGGLPGPELHPLEPPDP
jgi:hypothetical protein